MEIDQILATMRGIKSGNTRHKLIARIAELAERVVELEEENAKLKEQCSSDAARAVVRKWGEYRQRWPSTGKPEEWARSVQCDFEFFNDCINELAISLCADPAERIAERAERVAERTERVAEHAERVAERSAERVEENHNLRREIIDLKKRWTDDLDTCNALAGTRDRLVEGLAVLTKSRDSYREKVETLRGIKDQDKSRMSRIRSALQDPTLTESDQARKALAVLNE